MEHKGYNISAASFGLYEVKPVGRGSVHKSLRGKYTTPTSAQYAIDSFENSKVKGVKGGQTESEG